MHAIHDNKGLSLISLDPTFDRLGHPQSGVNIHPIRNALDRACNRKEGLPSQVVHHFIGPYDIARLSLQKPLSTRSIDSPVHEITRAEE